MAYSRGGLRDWTEERHTRRVKRVLANGTTVVENVQYAWRPGGVDANAAKGAGDAPTVHIGVSAVQPGGPAVHTGGPAVHTGAKVVGEPGGDGAEVAKGSGRSRGRRGAKGNGDPGVAGEEGGRASSHKGRRGVTGASDAGAVGVGAAGEEVRDSSHGRGRRTDNKKSRRVRRP